MRGPISKRLSDLARDPHHRRNTLLDVLIGAYYGRERPDQVARAQLFALMSQYGWTLWASIMDGSSTLDFDFWEWGMEKYERALATFDGPDLEKLLDAAGGVR